MTAVATFALHRHGWHPDLSGGVVGLGQGSSILDTTHGAAAFAVTEAGTIAATLTPFIGAMAAIPGLGPIIAAGTALVGFVISMFQGCGQTCTLTSQAADQVESKIKQAFAAYMTGGHTVSEQAAYLAVFDQFWAALAQFCGQASMGTAGQNCISDRQSGACKWRSSTDWGWKQTGSTWTFVESGPASPSGTCWNWVDYYRQTVANDPTVKPDPIISTVNTPSGQQTSILGMTVPSSMTPLLILAGVLIAVEALS